MNTLNWKHEKLHFRDAVLDAWVARSPKAELLELEWENVGPTLPMDTSLILRRPPVSSFEALPPDKELWKIQGLGSFDSIRFAKAVFNSPDDKLFREGVDSLEAIIAMLSEGFVEAEFKLNVVHPITLLFRLTKPNEKVTRKQYALMERLNKRFFGCDAKAVEYCVPGSFAIGAPM